MEDPRATEGGDRPGLRGPAVTALVALAGLGLVLAIEPLRTALDGIGGVLVVVVLSLLHSIVFYPAEILDAAVGFVYGFWPGLALVMGGWMLNAGVAYEIGRHGRVRCCIAPSAANASSATRG